MKKDTFYTIVIILLLIINLGTLGYLWLGNDRDVHRPPQHPGRPGAMMAKELKLDEVQKEQLDEIFRQHRRKMRKADEKLGSAKSTLLRLAKGKFDTNRKDSLLKIITIAEVEKNEVILQHFVDIRSILKEEQLELFDDLMDNVSERISRHGPMPSPRHHGPPPPMR